MSGHVARGDDGDSLIEILVALSILSVGVVVLLSALTTNITTTGVNRDQAQTEAVLASAAEYVKSLRTIPMTCPAGGSPTPVSAADVPRTSSFTVMYGPSESLNGASCADVIAVPVEVQGNGFDITVRVVKRS